MRRRRSAIVPGLVLGASFAGVIPMCAIVACSGPNTDPITNLRNIPFGVAAVAYCCFEAGGVADVAFQPDVTDAREAEASPLDAADAPSDVKDGS